LPLNILAVEKIKVNQRASHMLHAGKTSGFATAGPSSSRKREVGAMSKALLPGDMPFMA
jgi:hypothetical protein